MNEIAGSVIRRFASRLVGRTSTTAPGVEDVFNFYRVAHVLGARLRLRSSSRQLCHLSLEREAGDQNDVLLCVPRRDRNIGFFISVQDPERDLRVEGERCTGAIIVVRLFRIRGADLVAIRNPTVERFYCITDPIDENGQGRLAVGTVEVTASEQFVLTPASTDWVLPCHRAVLNPLARFLEHPLTASLALAILRDNPDVAISRHIAALAVLLTHTDIEIVGRAIMTEPKLLDQLSRATAGDPWFAKTVPDLVRWTRQPTRVPAQQLRVPPEDDYLADVPFTPHPSFGLLCNSAIRREISPSRTVCIVTTARNEGSYLIEWIAYHRSIGVEHIFVYSNSNEDGSDELLDALSASGFITWIPNDVGPTGSPQYRTYGHALSVLPDILDFRWAIVMDIDEFLGYDSDRFSSISDYFSWHENRAVDAVALCWLMYAPSQHINRTRGGIIERCHYREPGINAHVKSAFRPHLFWHSHAHYPHSAFWRPITFRNSEGETHTPGADGFLAFASQPTAGRAWINHYFFKSAEEFVWKWSRNRVDVAVKTLTMPKFESFALHAFFHFFDRTDMERDVRLVSCCHGLSNQTRLLLGVERVAQANYKVQAAYRTRIAALISTYLKFGPEPELNSNEERFRKLLSDWQPAE